MTTTEPRSRVTLEVHFCAERRTQRITFRSGDDAVAYLTKNADRLYAEPLMFDPQVNWPEERVLTTFPEVGPWTMDQERLMEHMNPTCEHGMSALLCEGPMHFMSADQERAMGW